VSNIIDADRLDAGTIGAMMRGLADAARACGVVVSGGEIACLGSRVGGYGPGSHVNWCATALGVIPDGRDPISGRTIEAGDAVVALRNVGLRSNGLTLARSILERAFGPHWHLACAAVGPWGDLLLSPSVVYARGVVEVLRSGADVRGIAHITGGGIPSNLGRILAGRGLGARLDTLYAPDSWLIELARVGDVRPADAYGQWNMGNGMLLVVPKSQAQRVVAALGERRLEAQVAGAVVRDDAISIDARPWGFGMHEFPTE
jgi:phosphoribosylformylglycinamidine cyclo-ligase